MVWHVRGLWEGEVGWSAVLGVADRFPGPKGACIWAACYLLGEGLLPGVAAFPLPMGCGHSAWAPGNATLHGVARCAACPLDTAVVVLPHVWAHCGPLPIFGHCALSPCSCQPEKMSSGNGVCRTDFGI